METQLAIAAPQIDSTIMEAALLGGDLSRLTPPQRLNYYRAVCDSLGLNALTKPFDFMKNKKGELIMYARKDCTEQLRKMRGISVNIVAREVTEGIFVVTAHAKDKTGREDESIGAVPIENTKGEDRANAMMKAETKSKRRVTLSICGLGLPDESEIDSIPGAQRVPFDSATTEPASRPHPIMRDVVVPAQPVDAEVVPPQAPPEPKASKEDVRALSIAMTKMGKRDREDVLAWCEGIIGHPISSRKDLTVSECAECTAATQSLDSEPGEPGSEG